MIKLLPCPFCGNADLYHNHLNAHTIGVQCNKCLANVYMELPSYTSYKNWKLRLFVKSAKKWNTRT